MDLAVTAIGRLTGLVSLRPRTLIGHPPRRESGESRLRLYDEPVQAQPTVHIDVGGLS